MEPLATSSEDLPGFEPVKFENVTDETVTCEQLKSKKNQLWLIKVPFDFDISTVTDTSIILNGAQGLSTKNKNEKRYETRASKYSDKQPCPFNTIVPSSTEPCSLQVAKDFTGHVDIMQTIQVPMLEYPPQSASMYTDIPTGLKVRWKPFGHETPMKKKQSPTKGTNGKVHKMKHKKKRMVEVENEVINEESCITSPKKKKKHKETKKEHGESSKRKKKSTSE